MCSSQLLHEMNIIADSNGAPDLSFPDSQNKARISEKLIIVGIRYSDEKYESHNYVMCHFTTFNNIEKCQVNKIVHGVVEIICKGWLPISTHLGHDIHEHAH